MSDERWMYYDRKEGDVVIIKDSKSTRHGKVGVISHVGKLAYWVRTDDGVDLPVWSCRKIAPSGGAANVR